MNSPRIGFGQADITPTLPFPLAGHMGLKERTAATIGDRLEARAVVLEDPMSGFLAAVVSLDILIIDHDLYRDSLNICREFGIRGLFLTATHTHSSFGGYLNSDSGWLFMGRRRPDLRSLLLSGIRRSLEQAMADLETLVALSTGQCVVPGLTMNRRVVAGPVDNTVRVVLLERSRSPILLTSTAGHPVIVSCRSPHTASSDYPGRVRSAFDAQGFRTIHLPGGLAASNILFPEMEIDLEDHLGLVTGLIRSGVMNALDGMQKSSDLSFGFQVRRLQLNAQRSPRAEGVSRHTIIGSLTGILGDAFASRLTPGHTNTPVTLVSLGQAVLVGMPADFGVYAAIKLTEQIRHTGLFAIIASHTNDYSGYIHLKSEYGHNQNHRSEFFHYENAMTWYGADLGDRLVEEASVQLRSVGSIHTDSVL